MMDRKTKAFTMISFAYFLWHSGAQWTMSLLPYLQWSTQPAMNFSEIANWHSFGSACNLFGALVIGQYIDAAGVKSVLCMMVAMTSLYYILMGVIKSQLGFFAIQLLRTGWHFDAATEIYIATSTSEAERTQTFMLLAVPLGAAMLIAPQIGTELVKYITMEHSIILNGLIMLLTLVPFIYFCMPETHSIPKGTSARLRPQDYIGLVKANKQLQEALIVRFFIACPNMAFELISRQMYLKDFAQHPYEGHLFLLGVAISVVLVQFVGYPLVVKQGFTPKAVMQISLALLMVLYWWTPHITSYFHLIVITALQASFFSLCFAESSTNITSAVDRVDLGKATGLAATVTWASNVIIPLLIRQITEHAHYTYTFYAGGIITLCTLCMVTVYCQFLEHRTKPGLPTMINV